MPTACDVLIKNALLFDGTGSYPLYRDVAGASASPTTILKLGVPSAAKCASSPR